MSTTSFKGRGFHQDHVEETEREVGSPGVAAREGTDLAGPFPGEEETDGAALTFLTFIWLYRGLFLAALDFLSIISCFMFSFYLRFEAGFIPVKGTSEVDVVKYLSAGLTLAVFWIFLLWRSETYEGGLRGVDAPISQVRNVVSCGFLALCALMVLSFLDRSMLLSRIVYVVAGMAAMPVMILTRHLFRAIEADLSRKYVDVFQIVVVGFSDQALKFAKHFTDGDRLMRIMGFVSTGKPDDPEEFHGYPVLGSLGDVPDLYRKRPFDTLVLCSTVFSATSGTVKEGEVFNVVNFCEEQGIALYDISHGFDVAVERHEVGSFQGIPIFRIRDAVAFPIYALTKRAIDIVVSSLGIISGLPFWLAIAGLVKFTSKGPVFYCEYRAGLHGKPYKMFKFRSMVADADSKLQELVGNFKDLKEPVFNIRKDPRVTRIGDILRRTSLDEIPQLWNVFKGEMSLIGPRPERVTIVEMYTPLQRRRLKAKPGITGLQQVISRGDPSLTARIKWDLIYLKQQSLFLDAIILIKTILVVFKGEGMK